MPNGSLSVEDQVEFSDNDFRLHAKGDWSKRVKFDLSGITTATERTITFSDANLTLGADFTGDSGSGGVHGLVPAPAAGDAAANKFLKANGGWAAVTSGMVLLGTLTTTSGTTQSLTGLTLSSYKALFCDVKGVSSGSAEVLTMALGSGATPTYGSAGTVSGTLGGAGAGTITGGVWVYGINLTTQAQIAFWAQNTNGTAASGTAKVVTGTAAVANAVRFIMSGTFDAGSIDVYGVP